MKRELTVLPWTDEDLDRLAEITLEDEVALMAELKRIAPALYRMLSRSRKRKKVSRGDDDDTKSRPATGA